MRSEVADEILALIARSEAQPTALEFEMAYQARVAIDRVRFAIKHTEQFGPHTDQMRHVGFQLLDALQRLESVDRRFQAKTRVTLETKGGRPAGIGEANDLDKAQSLNQANGCATQHRGAERAG